MAEIKDFIPRLQQFVNIRKQELPEIETARVLLSKVKYD